MQKKLPWYLNKKVVYFFCIVTPPVGYIILLTNLDKFEHLKKIEYLTIATIMMSIWILKFLPKELNNLVWLLIITLIIARFLIKLIKLKSKNF